MLSRVPSKLDKNGKEPIDAEIMRVAMIAELDAINLYEQLSAATDDDRLKRVLLRSRRRIERISANSNPCSSRSTASRSKSWKRARKKLSC